LLTLIEGGEVYTPRSLGRQSVLIGMGKILRVGAVNRQGLDLLDVGYDVIDASGCLVVPGFIDPHQHLLGGSGEGGHSAQSPMLFLSEIIPAGITTVVGVLGVDTTMKTMAGLLARVKALGDGGLSTRMWSGGYDVPPTTVMDSIRDDMLFIEEVIGAGEIAISDHRSLEPDPLALGRLVSDAHIGGLLSGKAGVTHFHVGDGRRRLSPLRALLERYDVRASWLYPTHVTRNPELFDEAIALAKAGAYVDSDTQIEDLPRYARCYLEQGGPPERFTLSSDAGGGSPQSLHREWRRCVVEGGLPLETMLPLVTRNTAEVLRLTAKGQLREGFDGDVTVLQKETLDVVHVIAGGRQLMRDGGVLVHERFLEASDRRIDLAGAKYENG
jgi:beta-aspartyl-dipeptidase (metallo-type)